MKKKARGFVSLLLMFGIAAVFFSCFSPVGSVGSPRANQTPVSGDYTVGNLSQTAGSVTAVIITAKSGKSPGAINNIRYANNPTPPQAAGTYPVTFDVAAASGWNAATGLSAGNLIVTNQTPVAGDYIFDNMTQTAGNVRAVTITARSGKSPGAIRNIRYNNSTAIPATAGNYAVTFDVAAASGWNAATGLSAGTLVVASSSGGNQTPVASDYTFGKLNQIAGSVEQVTITPNSGKSPGAISNIRYNNSTTIPATAGNYAVTFNVAAAAGWNAAQGLSAGTLVVTSSSGSIQTPVSGDYIFGNLSQMAWNVRAVTITARNGKSPGAISNIRYANNPTLPQDVGTYPVTFDVAAASGWTAATGLSAGNLIVTNQTPVAGDYDFGNLSQSTEDGIIPVTITAKSGRSTGAISKIYYNNSTAIPATAGMHVVTFDVDAAAGWNAAKGLSAGTLIVFYPFTITETLNAVTIIGYTGNKKDVTIPDQINGKNVTAIGNLAFNNKQLSSVSIPNSVTFIDNGAFANNQLTSVAIPDAVTTIGREAFYNNQLTGVKIPSGVTSISERAFSSNKLASVTFHDRVTYIGLYAFSYNLLNTVTIPDSVTYIRPYAFSYNQLTSVTIPNGVTTIEMYAFSENQLAAINNLTNITAIQEGAFRYNKLTSVTIPGSVKTIGEYAFSGNRDLNSVTIEAGVSIASESIPDGFYAVYINGGKQAGTYTRTNPSTTWTRQ